MIKKIGTLVVMIMKSNLTNFVVSRINSIAPPQVQKFNFNSTFEPVDLET